ncbi:hypothetical protein V8F20_009779 [Naviculisporaceae sp. PSN 640]
MSFLSYLVNPWAKGTKSNGNGKGKGRANDDHNRPESHESGLIFFPPFVPGEQPLPPRKEAPDPHGTKEFLRAVIAERAGTRQQVVRAGEDIRRANQEALKQAKVSHSHHTTITPAYSSAAASSLKAILARNPLPNPKAKAKQHQPAANEPTYAFTTRPALRRCDSSSSYITPVPPTTRIPSSPKNKQVKKANRKPSFFHIRFPTEPKKIMAKPERHNRPSPPIDPRLSPLGPMADRLVMMLDREDYDSDGE